MESARFGVSIPSASTSTRAWLLRFLNWYDSFFDSRLLDRITGTTTNSNSQQPRATIINTTRLISTTIRRNIIIGECISPRIGADSMANARIVIRNIILVIVVDILPVRLGTIQQQSGTIECSSKTSGNSILGTISRN